MRKLILGLLIPVFTHAQKLEGVWELKWGTSVDSAITIIKESKGYTPQLKKTDTTVTLIFMNSKWGFETSTFTRLEFYKDKLYSAIAFFTPDTPDEYFKLYTALKNSITEKYFTPQMDKEEFSQPFTKDDPNNKKMYAILKGYAHVGCSWDFSLASKFENNGVIALTITNDSGIILWYRDGNISNIVSKQVDEKAKKDF